MSELKTELKLSWWPSPQDYNEAVQIPRAYLDDPELQGGSVGLNPLGLPRPISGSFASVYQMSCGNKEFALRLFLRNILDGHKRYALISEFVQRDNLPYTVTFDYLNKGIKIRGEWFPGLKMDWVDGHQLDDYIVEHLENPEKLEQLASNFLKMMRELCIAGIAHGDLQHGNIIVCNEELRLVDYDGMFVPKMAGWQANELGHPNYQHPSRVAEHFGPYLDNFSAWVIYTSIKALQHDSRLLHQLGGGDDCLLFKRQDFLDPENSPAFAALENHQCQELRTLGRFVRAQLQCDLAEVPYLDMPVPSGDHEQLQPISENTSVVRSGPRLVRERSAARSEIAIDSSSKTAVASSNKLTLPAALQRPVPRPVRTNYSCGRVDAWRIQMMLFFLLCVLFPQSVRHHDEIMAMLQVAPWYLLVIFALFMGVEFWIWKLALRDRRFAKHGTPACSEVEALSIEVGSRQRELYKARVSYEQSGVPMFTMIDASASDYKELKVGDSEIILIDPSSKSDPIFYKFCRYHAAD